MRRFFAVAITIAICLGFAIPTQGQEEIPFDQPQVAYSFGEELIITTEIAADISIQTIKIVLQPEVSADSVADEIFLTSPNEATYSRNLSQNPLPAFSRIEYWYQGELENGDTFSSQHFSFVYTDNRFDWQSLQTEEFEIFWYEGDSDFGQQILNTAYAGLERIRQHVSVPAPQKVAFYVYANATEMQSVLQLSGQIATWIAGHANPALGMSLVSIPAGTSQSVEIKRQVPHELTHILLYRKLGDSYGNLPQWLNEGLASTSELSPDPNYALLLEKAYERKMLIPLAQLCDIFPTDAANFQLAYAQSASFTYYLQTKFGPTGMENLIAAYADGLDCERGVEVGLSATLSELEGNWRHVTFDENMFFVAINNMLPWVLILAVVLLPTLGLAFVGKKKNNEERI
ncbi:MAG: peptidase MA family metallohydrolase [Chloroflexota bacterium]|nr:peptidase MA family metallohydrolase [Chloroflexota bacterium]